MPWIQSLAPNTLPAIAFLLKKSRLPLTGFYTTPSTVLQKRSLQKMFALHNDLDMLGI
jgi:hypothetical protein